MYSTLCGAYHISESPQMDKVELRGRIKTPIELIEPT